MTPYLHPSDDWVRQVTRTRQAAAVCVHCAFIFPTGKYWSSCWLTRRMSVHTTPHAETEPGTPSQQPGRRWMRLIKTTAGDEQIKINTTPGNASIILATTSPSGEAQGSPVKSTAASRPIVLNTVPHPASGPGGPSLTSRRH